jgi:hypothetical protein
MHNLCMSLHAYFGGILVCHFVGKVCGPYVVTLFVGRLQSNITISNNPPILIHRVSKAVKFHTCSRRRLSMWWKEPWRITYVAVISFRCDGKTNHEENHTCSLGSHLAWWKSKSKGHGFALLEKDTNCTQVFVSQLSELGQPMLCIWVGENLVFENLWQLQNLDITVIFLLLFC